MFGFRFFERQTLENGRAQNLHVRCCQTHHSGLLFQHNPYIMEYMDYNDTVLSRGLTENGQEVELTIDLFDSRLLEAFSNTLVQSSDKICYGQPYFAVLFPVFLFQIISNLTNR